MSVVTIIPVWNRPHSLFRSLHSAVTQSYEHQTIVVIGDGCNQDMWKQYLDVVSSFNDSRIVSLNTDSHYEQNVHNSGAYARNYALDWVSKGSFSWIAPLDDDDCWLPHHLSSSLGLLEKSGADLVHGAFLKVHGSSGRVTTEGGPVDRQFRKKKRNYCIGHSSVVYRAALTREKYSTKGVFPSDWDLWLRLWNDKQRFVYDDKIHFIHYR